MKEYLPNLIVLAVYLLLFIKSRGLFSSAARELRKVFHCPDEVGENAVRTVLIGFFLLNLLAAASVYLGVKEDTVSSGYLLRSPYGGSARDETLEIEWEGERREIDLTISARQLSGQECSDILDGAETVLSEMFREAGEESEGIFMLSRDLSLPDRLEGFPVSISWMSDHPEYLDFSGHITEKVPEGGAQVRLTATISCGDLLREKEFSVLAMPEVLDDEEVLQRRIRAAVSEENDESQERVILPDSIDGEKIYWFSKKTQRGIGILMPGALIGALYLYAGVKKKEEREAERAECMRKEYPSIVEKLVLLMTAGLSLRGAFARIARDYERKKGAGEKPGYEEIVRTVKEMEHGIPEIEAYRHMGKRCRAAEYRTFSSMLVQNLQKGGAELIRILEREAAEAQDGRRKRARILGEEAGTKLLMPMVLMLIIVMAVLMVPAYLSFR